VKNIAKECYHKITSQIKAIERDLKDTNNDPEIRTNKEKQRHKAYLTSQLKQLKKKEAKDKKDLLNAKLANHGE